MAAWLLFRRARSPARASALARTTSGSRGSGGRTSCQGRSRRTLSRWTRSAALFLISSVGHPSRGVNGEQPGPVGLALRGTVRIPAAVGRHL